MPTILTAQEYLHDAIPISKQMGVQVLGLDESSAVLAAKFEPNTNHESTAFGGSISALAILAGWTFIWGRLRSLLPTSRIVIQESTIRYLRPIESDFVATCRSPADAHWDRFLQQIRKRGRGRIGLDVVVTVGTQSSAEFVGRYVALKEAPNP